MKRRRNDSRHISRSNWRYDAVLEFTCVLYYSPEALAAYRKALRAWKRAGGPGHPVGQARRKGESVKHWHARADSPLMVYAPCAGA